MLYYGVLCRNYERNITIETNLSEDSVEQKNYLNHGPINFININQITSQM